jgi:hypothetical protein
VRPLALASLGFLLAAGPMLTHVPRILLGDVSNHGAPERGQPELAEKLDVAAAMYDGTYFYRLMDQGGRFDRMDDAHPPIRAPLGVALALAAGVLIAGRAGTFILLAALFITVGVFAMPGAVRIHHLVAVYPFPHLAVALAVTRLSERGSRWLSATGAALVALLLASQLAAILGTQRVIRETGGRGWWSDALTAFAREVRDRADTTIASLDWGFGEQLAFLTDGPTLVEPFWSRDASFARSASTIFLVHPREYQLFPLGERALEGRAQRRAGIGGDPRVARPRGCGCVLLAALDGGQPSRGTSSAPCEIRLSIVAGVEAQQLPADLARVFTEPRRLLEDDVLGAGRAERGTLERHPAAHLLIDPARVATRDEVRIVELIGSGEHRPARHTVALQRLRDLVLVAQARPRRELLVDRVVRGEAPLGGDEAPDRSPTRDFRARRPDSSSRRRRAPRSRTTAARRGTDRRRSARRGRCGCRAARPSRAGVRPSRAGRRADPSPPRPAPPRRARPSGCARARGAAPAR